MKEDYVSGYVIFVRDHMASLKCVQAEEQKGKFKEKLSLLSLLSL